MKNKFILLFCMILVSLTLVSALQGSGTEQDPFIISDCGKLSEIQYDQQSYYIITNDIDCHNSIWGSWTPIPTFTGTLDGQGYTISNLYMSGVDNMGLFGQLGGGTLKNINLENVSVSGVFYVGGLVGRYNSGHIEFCSVTGNIVGYSRVGGLVGEHGGGESVVNCYSMATVTGNDVESSYIGGLIGLQGNSYTTYSYSAGETYYTSSCLSCGGLMGADFVSATTHSFFNSDNTEYPNGIGISKTTEELKDINTYLNDGWTITPTSVYSNEGYPYFSEGGWVIYVEPQTETPPTSGGILHYDNLIEQQEQAQEQTQITGEATTEVKSQFSLFQGVKNFFASIKNWFGRWF